MLVACSSLMKIMALVWVDKLSRVRSKAGSSEDAVMGRGNLGHVGGL